MTTIEDKKNNEQSTQQKDMNHQQTTIIKNPFDAMRNEKVDPMNPAILEENQFLKSLKKAGVDNSDKRYELAMKYPKVFPMRRVDLELALKGKTAIDKLFICREIMLHLVNASISRMGMKIDRIESEYKKLIPFIEIFDETIKEVINKIKA